MIEPDINKQRPVLTPALRWLVRGLMVAFALLVVNSVYLLSVSTAGSITGADHQTVFSVWMFLIHIVVGLAVSLPFLWFGIAHFSLASSRSNRSAVRLGLVAFIAGILTIISGVLLMRVEYGSIALSVRGLATRETLWWFHLGAPAIFVWMFLLHRLAGPRIRWRMGGLLAAIAIGTGGLGFVLHDSLSGKSQEAKPTAGDSYFHPSMARTDTGSFIPASSLMQNDECLTCHADIYHSWSHSVHAASSFNNPLYAFSVRETRQRAFAREGNVQDARFCAGCHDPVPFFSGAFEESRWDDPNYDAAHDPVGAASITCNACHAICEVGTPTGSTSGNADYVIAQPVEYPFAQADNSFLRWVNHQLIRARPQLHKRTFLKPEVHRSTEFCGTCHKVFLPEDVNDYRWLRGQNHYDSFRLSAVSGFGAQSWYYPAKAETNCNNCHMQPLPSDDPAAKPRGILGQLTVLDHGFVSSNTATPMLSGLPDAQKVIAECEAFNEKVMRIDLIGIREGGEIDGVLTAPLGPSIPTLVRGQRYLLETVLRAVKMGHEFTQGTADSNEVWLDVDVQSGGRSVGRSGAMNAARAVDPWSKFINAYVIDREGNRIERRNPQDIFVTLYNNQVPPGAADLTHFAFTVPPDAGDELKIKVSLRYRKFDLTYWRAVMGPEAINELPVMTLAEAEVVFPVGAVQGEAKIVSVNADQPEEWMRWYDYGIGLFRQGERGSGKGDLRQSDLVFAKVEKLGRAEGSMGRARTALKEGRIDDASQHLRSAAAATPPAYPWSIRWFSALANRQNGLLENAAIDLEALIASDFPEAVNRGFDFSKDDRVLVELGNVLLEMARAADKNPDQASASSGESNSLAMRNRARDLAKRALDLDPENVSAWYLLSQVQSQLGDEAAAIASLAQHAKFKPDENARDRAVNLARLRDSAANHASEAIVIYDLNRPERFEGMVEQVPSTNNQVQAER
ncbi:MAG: tetratricopeptide repeat protein [Planctomycetota bacterium]|nr:tetratricopeptide repeat protein [Planctomycetota bacterium]MDA1262102.1 tetratricopeptide repeat protein [Planctomycetota bacterium]